MNNLLLALALLATLATPTSAHAASDAKCKAAAISAVDEDSSSETSVKAITAGKKYQVTVSGEDESSFEVTFPSGCDSAPAVKELSDSGDADAGADASVSRSHSHFGNRCLQDEIYFQGQCCKFNPPHAPECPAKKPAKHLHDLKR